MKTALIAIGVAVVGFIAVIGGSYVSAYNSGNSAETRIHSIYENNQQMLGQYGQKVAEALGVAELDRETMGDILAESLDARYGDDGVQAAMTMIAEDFPDLDNDTYKQVQRIIEAGRNDFQTAQTMLIDAKRSYRDRLGSFWAGTMLDMAGYPRINIGYPLGMQDDYPAITTERAKKTFETGVECGNALTAAKGTDGC